MDAKIQQVARWLREAVQAVAFTGAGISTESHIPDFRSPGGVWSKYRTVYFDEFVASPAARHEYWRQKCESHADFARAEPNAGHQCLAAWEQAGRIRGVITQNIDGLHHLAGSQRVLELHGTARWIACLGCQQRWPADPWVAQFLSDSNVPDCPQCGGLLKHATVSFGQSMPEAVMNEAVAWAQSADLTLALGSSLVVEPAASIPRLTARSGGKLVIINRDPTPVDELADIVIRAPLGATLVAINAALG